MVQRPQQAINRSNPGSGTRRVRFVGRWPFKEYILPLIFTKRLCDVFDDEINRIAKRLARGLPAYPRSSTDARGHGWA